MRVRPGLVLIAITLWSAACSSDGSAESSAGTGSSVAPTVDRSLDVSYIGGVVELSFARVGDPFRAMHAQVLRWSDDGWSYFGTLRTTNANTVGTLTTEAEAEVELLDGTNNGPQADEYRAPQLPSGRYLICTSVLEFEPAEGRQVCGELDVA